VKVLTTLEVLVAEAVTAAVVFSILVAAAHPAGAAPATVGKQPDRDSLWLFHFDSQ
jgi:hypothetical protein